MTQRIQGRGSWCTARTQRPSFGVTGGYCLLQWLGSRGVTGGNSSGLRLPTAHEEHLPAPWAHGDRNATETCVFFLCFFLGGIGIRWDKDGIR